MFLWQDRFLKIDTKKANEIWKKEVASIDVP
jgi:hypothetical protein